MKKLIVLNRVKCAWEYARFQCSILVLVAFYVFESSRTMIMKVEANGAWNNPLVSNKSPWLIYTTSRAQIFSSLSASFSSQWWRYLVPGDWSEGFIMQVVEQNGGSLLWYSSYDSDTWNDKCNITVVLLKLANSHSFCSLTEWRLILENRNYCLGFWIMTFLFGCIDHQLPIVIWSNLFVILDLL